jgi:voltage-gated potassium channel
MAAMVLHPLVSDYLDIVTHGDEIEFRLDSMPVGRASRLAGATIKEARVRDATGAYILAVRSEGGQVNANPPAETLLNAGDELVVLGTREQLAELAALL